MTRPSWIAVFVAAGLAAGGAVAGAERSPLPAQDPDVLRFAERALAWYPGSSFQIVQDEVRQTASGSYRVLVVERSCASPFLSGATAITVDQIRGEAWVGSRGELAPPGAAPPADLRASLESALPKIRREKVRLEWDQEPRAGALIPFTLHVETGYGSYREPAAVTADGRLLVSGERLPFDRDPVEVRRELLRASGLVVWDHGAPEARVELVEFSDFECPGCKATWSRLKRVLDSVGNTVRHGFVAFPLTTIHPWAFRAACAGVCVAEQKPLQLLPLKELFYSLQGDMEVSEVTPTAHDFVLANGLDRARFDACYLRPPSLDGVHRQLSLGNRLAVNATPTFFVDGWRVQAPEEGWLREMLDSLVAGKEP